MNGSVGRRSVASTDHQGLSAVQVWQHPRIDVGHGQAAPVDRHIGQQRGPQPLIESVCSCVCLVTFLDGDHLRFSPPRFGHRFDQKPIDRGTHSEGEHSRIGVHLHFADDFEVVADVAVGEETHDPQMILRVGGVERCADGIHHHGSASATFHAQHRLCFGDIFDRGKHGLREQDLCVAGESDQIEGVARIKLVERMADECLRLFNWEPAHRSRGVEHEDEFLRRDIRFRYARRRLQDQSKVSARTQLAACRGLRQHGVADLVAGNAVLQDEVFVRDYRQVLEFHGRCARAGAVHLDFMRTGTHVSNRDARIDGQLNGNIMPRTGSLRRYWRSDVGRVRNAVGVGRPAAALLSSRLSRNVARPDDRGEDKLV